MVCARAAFLQDKQTRDAAAHGLAVYMHLLQLSADRSLLCHFAEVHEFNMQCRKRLKKGDSRKRQLQQRHKAATFAFREVRQLLTLLGSLRASVQLLQDAETDQSSIAPQATATLQVSSVLYGLATMPSMRLEGRLSLCCLPC